MCKPFTVEAEATEAKAVVSRELKMETKRANVENITVLDATNFKTDTDVVSKMVKVWESKNAQRALRGAGLSTMALSLAACGGSSSSDDGAAAPVTPVGGVVRLTVGADNTLTNTTELASAGDDTIDASESSNDNGGATTNNATLNALDVVDGGDGIDTLNITSTAAFGGIVGTISNVEIINITSAAGVTASTAAIAGVTDLGVVAAGDGNGANVAVAGAITAGAATDVVGTFTAVADDTIAVQGGNDVTVTAGAVNGGTVTIGTTTAAAGDVVVNISGGAAASTIGLTTVTGGDTVSVTTNAVNAVNTTLTLGAVTVTGDAGTTSVTINQAAAATAAAAVVGVSVGGVNTITDAAAAAGVADTIATVTLSNFGATTIVSSELSTLNVTGGSAAGLASGALVLTAQSATGAETTLNLNSAGGFMGAISGTQANAYTTINVNSSAATTIADLTSTGLATLNFTGSGNTTLTASTLGAAITDINVTGTGGVSLGTALGAAVDFDGNAGADTITITGAATVGYTMGAGNDTVTITGGTIAGAGMGAGGSLAGGDGVDEIVMAFADAVAASANAAFNTDVTGFETLRITGNLTGALNTQGINDVSRVELAGAAGAAAVINNLAANGTIELTTADAGGGAVTVNMNGAVARPADTLNVVLTNAAATAFDEIAAANIESVAIVAADATAIGGAAVVHTIDLSGITAATSVTYSGNNGAGFTSVATVTSFDASGVVANAPATGGAADTAAGLAVAFTSINATANAAVSITGGAGNDALAGSAAAINVDTIDGGAGNDTITGALGADTLTGGAGRDSFVYGANDSLTGSFDTITDFGLLTSALTAAQNAGATAAGMQAAAVYGSADVLNFGGAPTVAAAVAAGTAGQAAGVTVTVANGILTLQGAGASTVDTLGEWITEAAATNGANDGNAVAFEFGGDTYVLVDAAADILVCLDGVTGVAAVADIAAGGALAANTLIIA